MGRKLLQNWVKKKYKKKDFDPLLRQLLKLLLAELRWLLEEEKQSKAGGAFCWSLDQELESSMEVVGQNFRERANRSPPSSARSWTAPWQLVQQWRRRAEVGPAADKL